MYQRFYSMLLFLFIAIPVCSQDRPDSETFMVEMRDGIKLATEVYFPKEGDGPWPVILVRTQYGRLDQRESEEQKISKGIAVVYQDVRGTGDSEGMYEMLTASGWGKKQDGYDTVEWVLEQPWCNGNIATDGGSASGMTEILLAGTGPRGIVGQRIAVTTSGLHRVYYTGGVLRKLFVETVADWYEDKEHSIELVRSHFTYDDYWKTLNLDERADRVNWPVVLQTGWYDFGVQGCIDAFNAIQERGGPKAQNNVHLLIWPGGHNNDAGDFEFPDELFTNIISFPYEHFDHWLLDKPMPDDVPTIQYYTMGENPIGNSPGNEWRTADTWPPEESRLVPFYLNDGGDLHQKKPAKSKVTFEYDPKKPVPTNGGQVFFMDYGAFDQRESEKRNDVIVFSTPPLKEPVEVTGRITAVLYVSTSAVDTDFTAELTDVYPDGRSMILTHGIQRLSFRNSFEKHELATPGEIYKLEIDLLSTSMVFNKGHRIRVAISSSNSPWFEPNPNTGVPNDSIDNSVKANQTIYMGGERASYINLPIVGSLEGLD